MTAGLALALLLAAAPPPAPPALPAGSPCPEWEANETAYLERLETRLAALVDERRRAAGAATLSPHPALSGVAQAHARHLAELGLMRHRTDDTGGVEDRLRAASLFDWDAVGENLAQSRPVTYTSRNHDGSAPTIACHTPESLALAIVQAWDESAGHARTLRDGRFNVLGSGAAFVPGPEVIYVVHDFAHVVSCGYKDGPCCPPPAGRPGGVCLVPFQCREERCLPRLPETTLPPPP